MITQIVISALSLGAVYALIAIGFTIVFATKRIINFAHGEFVMLGGVLAVYFSQTLGLPMAAALLATVVCVAAIALVLYLLVLDQKAGDPLAQVMITLGLAIAIKGAVEVTIGKSTLFLPPLSSAATWPVFGIFISPQAAWIVLTLVVLSLGLAVVLRTTWLGLSMRAVALDPYAAVLMGVAPRWIAASSFAIAGFFGAAAGALVAPIASASYDNGLFLGLKGFGAAILGGIGSPIGAVVGGLILGLTEALSAGYLSSAYKDAITLSLLFVVLMLFPQGLLGGRALKKL
ncbi:branched-chain amino acid ABC transporter permease [Chelatococcus reniformis]|uniref:Branched-chain amino acid ABC transporter permease n=1 Tax=Chelatococcus reniformis TaxID=1494448 RepID=A0A916UA56_9HYPH|nr:branched-chain amino acid ABC transporter permease [Chelatococcus reniformis]GGC65033.1 branched-chain amino acid ABC transporter permease [Chelatococcus reniformis]